MAQPARIAIDLGAESCRVSLLRWIEGEPKIEVILRIPNGPVHQGRAMIWPLETLLAGIEEGLEKAAQAAPEGIASIAVDSWSVDYVRLGADGLLLRAPFCYRDERTEAAKKTADSLISPEVLYERTGALPHRINTVYQLIADREAGIDDGLNALAWRRRELSPRAHLFGDAPGQGAEGRFQQTVLVAEVMRDQSRRHTCTSGDLRKRRAHIAKFR